MGSNRTAWPLAAVLLASGCFQAEAPRPVSTPAAAVEAAAPVRPAPLPTEVREPSVPELAAVLQGNPDPALRREAIYEIADAGNAADTGFIAEALNDPDPEVRHAAVVSLVSTRGETSAAWLALALNDPDPRIRLDAAEGLGEVGGPTARTALQQALLDPDPAVREVAAEMLDEPSQR